MEKPMRGRILIVDDDVSILRTLKLLLRDDFELVQTISNPKFIPSEIKKQRYDVILLDMNFSIGKQSGDEGLFWLKQILEIDPTQVVIMITAYGEINLAIKAIKIGATDFIVKPWENIKLIATIRTGVKLCQSNRNISRLEAQHQMMDEDNQRQFHFIPGSSPGMLEVVKIINKVAATDANVLLLGDNGTGKELIARDIHNKSDRGNKIFLSVDLGSLSETLFESELFGHVKGAFTGADSNKAGRFEIAEGGTLFLDEIGNLPLSLQGKLLTAIQQRKITPLGSADERETDIRFICATNQRLLDMVKENLFREDLLYRINTVQIEIPPLRERGEDIIQLADHFLLKYARKYNKPNSRFTSGALQKLSRHSWPGNVRELEHAVERAVILSEGNILVEEDFVFSPKSGFEEESLTSIEDIEKHYIIKSLEKNRGKLTKVAEDLNLSRQTIYRKMKKYGL
ncbi:MAG: sigma-54-dependent Fis family transcriptional regulator [Bacteroidetes bacterium]|nr:sigma-54-dependent Fis family transcriptional regulator [Bacteroidota bacterium]